MIAGLIGRGVHHRIAARELVFAALNDVVATHVSLAAPDTNASAELINQPFIPIAGVGVLCGFTIALERGNRIEIAVDGAGFQAHNKIGGAAVYGDLIDIIIGFRQWMKQAIDCAAIEVGNRCTVAAIAAVTDDFIGLLPLFIQGKYWNAFAVVIINQRLFTGDFIFTAQEGIGGWPGKECFDRTTFANSDREREILCRSTTFSRVVS